MCAHSLTGVCHTHTLSTHIKSSDFDLIIVVILESGEICLLGTMAGEVSPGQLLHAMLFNPLLDREHFVGYCVSSRALAQKSLTHEVT